MYRYAAFKHPSCIEDAFISSRHRPKLSAGELNFVATDHSIKFLLPLHRGFSACIIFIAFGPLRGSRSRGWDSKFENADMYRFVATSYRSRVVSARLKRYAAGKDHTGMNTGARVWSTKHLNRSQQDSLRCPSPQKLQPSQSRKLPYWKEQGNRVE
jgi:hypothetical protein